MKASSYLNYRDNIRSGDLLIWSKNESSIFSNVILNGIRVLTVSEYGHVGIAIRILGRLFVIEATIPCIRLSLVSEKEEFYHIPVDVSWRQDCEDYLFSKLNLKYSILDSVRAYLGLTVSSDDKYQCVELAREFYIKMNNYIFENNFRPSTFIKELLDITGSSIHLVKKTEIGET